MIARSLSLLLLLSLPAPAQEPPRLVAALSGDWNGDGLADAVTIGLDAQGLGVVTLYLGDASLGLRPHLTLPDAVWSGEMAGTLPGLAPRSETSFALQSEQSAVGRSPWQQSVTIAFRGGAFVVAGFDYSTYDRLDPDHSATCSVNLLTGAFTLRVDPEGPAAETTRSGDSGERAFPLAALTSGYSPAVCQPAYQ